ncbi:MAG TPA: heme-binding domain-containing protein [Salinimicrobium sp.]|nr:heme-binding domain-containing protein [Salinimicrobium sp.]
MKVFKIIAVVLLVAFVGIQFIPTNRNHSEEVPPSDFMLVKNVPKEVKSILMISCYDCHSNNTQYPWYQRIQPVSWYLEGHIEDGKEELNFSDFGNYSDRMQKAKMRSIISQVEDGKMPLPSYTLLHPEAELTAEEKQLLVKWIEEMQ